MKNELNYLSSKIFKLEGFNTQLQDHLDRGLGVGGRIGEKYRQDIKVNTDEIEMLESILTKLTLIELESK